MLSAPGTDGLRFPKTSKPRRPDPGRVVDDVETAPELRVELDDAPAEVPPPPSSKKSKLPSPLLGFPFVHVQGPGSGPGSPAEKFNAAQLAAGKALAKAPMPTAAAPAKKKTSKAAKPAPAGIRIIETKGGPVVTAAAPPAAPAAPTIEAPAVVAAPPVKPVKPAPRLSAEELRVELEAHGVRRLAELRALGLRLGFQGTAPKAPTGRTGGKGIWSFVLGLMRRDCGATEEEIAKLLSEQFGDPKRLTITTNLGAFRMLCGGRGTKEAAVTIGIVEGAEGRRYSILGGRLNGKPGILNEIAKCLMQPGGATEAACVEHLTKVFPDRSADSMKSTVATQINMWKTIIPAGNKAAQFSITTGVDQKPIFRLL